MSSEVDWAAVVERLHEGDRLAFLELNRLVTGFLVQLRAYDFRDEWDDLVQDVIWIVVEKARSGEIENPDALGAFVRTTTHWTFRSHLKRAKRVDYSEELDEKPDTICWPKEVQGPDTEELREQVRRLPDRQRRVIEAKY